MLQAHDIDAHERVQNVLALVALINGGAMTKAACVAAELCIPDHLAGGARRIDELAQATGAHGPSLHRLMRALASLGLCIERDDGGFELTPVGALLRTDAPESLRASAIWYGRHMWTTWGNLLHSVKTGESARKLTTGADGFGHLVGDKEASEIFNRAMAEMTHIVAREVVGRYDFFGLRRIADIGGGHGALLKTVLDAYPDMCGMLFDMPHAIAEAKVRLEGTDAARRCEFIAGDFFEEVPGGANAYLLKAVIHDWNDEQSVVILRNCRRVMSPDDRLLLVERVRAERVRASWIDNAIARADLTMLIGPGGRERTREEFSALLSASGFRLARIVATALDYSVLEALSQ
jgi:orsellinic acid C2-O-methyltransferase